MKKLTIGILAHVDSGKTTLSEAILYSSGSIRTQGRVDHKNTFLDSFELERKRGITIFSKLARMNVDDFEMLTDIEECEEDFEVRLSPNPASSVLNIDVDDMMDKEANVTIFDMLGRSRMDRDVSLDGNTVTLDVSILEKGMYFCVMTIDERRVLRKKFVKE